MKLRIKLAMFWLSVSQYVVTIVLLDQPCNRKLIQQNMSVSSQLKLAFS